MAAYRHPYHTTQSSGWPGRKPFFLFIVSLVCLTGFYAFGRRHVARVHIDRAQIERRAPIVGRAWIVDGDSIRIAGTSIRLEGIDAPEWDQTCADSNGRTWRCGQAATRELREHIGGRELTCRPRALDRYGRTVANCSLPDGTDVNAWLVRRGWAVAFGFTNIYGSEEAEAKSEKRGIWAGSFVYPSEWRRQKSNHRHRWSWWQ